MNRRYSVGGIVLLVLVIAVFSAGYGDGSKETLKEYVRENGGSIASEGFVVEEHAETEAGEVLATEIKGKSSNTTVRAKFLRNGGRRFAEKYIGDRRRTIRSLYISQPSPYGGIPTRNVSCPQRFRPNITTVQQGKENYTVYTLYADQELEYGVCNPEEADYRSVGLVGYCSRSDTVFQFEFFVPVGESMSGVQRIRQSFRCRK